MTGNAAWLSTSRVSRRDANSRWTIGCGAVTACIAGSWLAACRDTARPANSSASSARRSTSPIDGGRNRRCARAKSDIARWSTARPNWCAVSRRDLTLTFVNEAYCRFLGKQREAVLGTKLSAHLPADTREHLAQSVAHALSGAGPGEWQCEITFADGSRGWQHWTCRAIDGAGETPDRIAGHRPRHHRSQAGRRSASPAGAYGAARGGGRTHCAWWRMKSISRCARS